jgi:hypothetical protein
MSFYSEEIDNVVLWTGKPDCQAGHGFILDQLKQLGVVFLSGDSLVNNSVVGNIGEFTAFSLAIQDSNFADFRPFAANALNPLSRISRNELDIVWIRFGETSRDDLAVLQEVKTTSNPSLAYADNLIDDYDKLFAPNPQFTLHTRLWAIKNVLEFTLGQPELCPRVSELAGTRPENSSKIHLLPTAFHERTGSDPRRKMIAIRSTLCGKGWSTAAVKAWGIGLSDLGSRLVRLAMGHI